jgi:hypothetical protein
VIPSAARGVIPSTGMPSAEPEDLAPENSIDAVIRFH